MWQLFFNSAAMGPNLKIIVGMEKVLILLENFLYTYLLAEPCTNNMAKYIALIIRLQLAEKMGIKYLKNYNDSKLMINQVKGEHKVRNKYLIPYHQATKAWAKMFKVFYITTYHEKKKIISFFCCYFGITH